MRIWHENYTLEHVIALRDNNLNRHLGIKFTEISDNSITATMPVEDFTRQSRGVLHGGASCVLAEALGKHCIKSMFRHEKAKSCRFRNKC
jgi:1,4-dihydroxy-2-naphthoyl-CoA hydrolase